MIESEFGKNEKRESPEESRIDKEEFMEKEIEKKTPLWVTKMSDKIVETFPEKEVYTFAAGISPSGTVHFGNFRDVMTCLPLVEELNARGFNTRFIFSWDDFDRFRKVPANVPKSYEKYIGMPLTAVPDPTGETESYAQYFQKEFEKSMEELGIEMEYFYQTQEYQSGRYDEEIIRALENRKEIAHILLSLMSDKSKKAKGIDPEKYAEEYYPISLYSRFTGKDNTKILKVDGSLVTYRCLDSDKEETIDITKERVVKLHWKVDWAMRWKAEDVAMEPGGHDHASPGGSYDASSRIIRAVYDREPPVFVGYEFIGLQGLEGKMSSSSGEVISPKELLNIYQPEILKWLYTRKSPEQKFELAFDTEIFRQYDEYDREHSGDDVIPFRQAVAFGEILQWDIEKIYEILERIGFEYDRELVKERVERAKYWLEKYNPEKMIKIRDEVNEEYVEEMEEESKDSVRKVKQFLEENENPTIEELTTVLYDIPKTGMEDSSKRAIKEKQKLFYRDMYNLLISADQGPRLATFLYALDRKKILDLLDI